MNHEDPIFSRWQGILNLGTEPMFSIGTTAVTPMRLVGLIAILIAVWWFASMLERWITHMVEKRSGSVENRPGAYAVARIARYTVWIVGTLIGLNFVGFDIATLALFSGAIGIGIGLGLQSIFSNFISGIVLLLERTLKVGDFVDLQSGVLGTVTEIGMRYTRVTTNDNVDIIVPNSEFINGRVTNWTHNERSRRIHVQFSVAYGSNKEAVRDAAIAAAMSVVGTVTDQKRAPEVWLVRMGDNGLEFELVIWINNTLMIAPARTNAHYLWALETELRRANIEVPFPQRDLHVRSGSLQVRVEQMERPSKP